MAENNSSVQANVSEVSDNVSQKTVEVTVGDLQVMINIIEAVTARGGFRAPELKGVGEYFEKITALIPKEETPATTSQ
jgi:hypothetical protein